jgi:peptidoglycan hydrolase-like protein with peptidoglycan-binding domain
LIQLADPSEVVAYGAGWANADPDEGGVVQIEIVQGPDGEVYEDQLRVACDWAELLAKVYPIKREVQHVYHGHPVPKIREKWRNLSGVFGHCDLTEQRGEGDPGQQIRDALVARGWAAVDHAKTRAPVIPIPSWLDPAMEIQPEGWGTTRGHAVVRALAGARPWVDTITQAFEIVANEAGETAWFTAHGDNNLGGVKIREAYVKRYVAVHGRPPKWWKKRGHKESGDGEWCFYVGSYDSASAFSEEWVDTYVARKPVPKSRYYLTAVAFWRGGDWFRELIDAGYKGTPPDPEQSIRNHVRLTHTVRYLAAQQLLGVSADGIWGPKSEAVCREYQRTHGLQATGYPDDATIASLAA